jgi:hypothetical protein
MFSETYSRKSFFLVLLLLQHFKFRLRLQAMKQ